MMKSFTDYLEQVKPEIDDRIKQICDKELNDPDVTPILLKGKRLRGTLLMLVYDSLSADNRDEALDLACAIELAHAASLILDDMLDEDTERRGLQTVHLKKGHKKAMLDTIGILSVPYDIISQYDKIYVKELSEIQRKMSFGAAKELLKPDLPATKLYDLIITNKTGRLFGLATGWGYRAATGYLGKKSVRKKFVEYGLHCGKAMQIADDISDLKEIMDGKKTSGFGSELLLLRCMTVDRLAKELIHDIKNRSLDKTKVKELWTDKGLQKTLRNQLDKEIDKARDTIFFDVHIPYIDYEQILLDAPYTIAYMKLRGY